MKYQAVNKRAYLALMSRRKLGADKPNIFDVSQWPKWWESGAASLEKSSPGKLITAPIRLPEAILSATQKTVEQVPGTLKTVVNTLPLLAIAAAIVGSGYLVYKFKKKDI